MALKVERSPAENVRGMTAVQISWDEFSAWMKENQLLENPPDPVAAYDNKLLPGAGV